MPYIILLKMRYLYTFLVGALFMEIAVGREILWKPTRCLSIDRDELVACSDVFQVDSTTTITRLPISAENPLIWGVLMVLITPIRIRPVGLHYFARRMSVRVGVKQMCPLMGRFLKYPASDVIIPTILLFKIY